MHAVRFTGKFVRCLGRGGLGKLRVQDEKRVLQVQGGAQASFRGQDLRLMQGYGGLGPRSPVDIGPEVSAEHVHRLDAASILQSHGPFRQHPRRSVYGWVPSWSSLSQVPRAWCTCSR